MGWLVNTPDGLKGALREKVAAELEPYSTSSEDIEATYQALLHAFAQGIQERTE